MNTLITDEFIPKLLEINRNPSMEIDNEISNKIKPNLFVDTLNLVGIVPYSRKSRAPFNPQFKNKRDINENLNNAFCELKRPKGDYDLIFPTKENINKYKKYFIYNNEENKKFWNQLIINEKKK